MTTTGFTSGIFALRFRCSKRRTQQFVASDAERTVPRHPVAGLSKKCRSKVDLPLAELPLDSLCVGNIATVEVSCYILSVLYGFLLKWGVIQQRSEAKAVSSRKLRSTSYCLEVLALAVINRLILVMTYIRKLLYEFRRLCAPIMSIGLA